MKQQLRVLMTRTDDRTRVRLCLDPKQVELPVSNVTTLIAAYSNAMDNMAANAESLHLVIIGLLVVRDNYLLIPSMVFLLCVIIWELY